MTWRDFLRFLGRLVRDGYLIALVVFDAIYFGLGWIASATGRFSVPPMRLSGYLAIFLAGVVVAAYRNELRFRAEMEDATGRLKALIEVTPPPDLQADMPGFNQADDYGVRIARPHRVPLFPDLLMDMEGFNKLVKPKQEAEGYEVKLPRPERLPLYTSEGWQPVLFPDESGHPRRVVIGDSNRIDLVPIRRKL